MFRRLGRHIKEGFFGVIRHSAMAISSASAVTITLMLMSIFFLFSFNVDMITKSIEETVRIQASISFDYETSEQITSMQNQISAIPGVKFVEFFTKEDELDYYLEHVLSTEESREILEPYREDNPFHHVFYIEVLDGNNVKEITAKIESIEGIVGANYGGDSAVMLIQTMNSIRFGGFILVAALSALAIFLINNTIKLTIYARSNEIAIMRSVGATNGYIRAPFVIEGIFIGILGGIIPVLFTIFGYIYLYNELGGVLLTNMFTLIHPHPFVLNIALLLVGIAVVVGLIGSFFSVTRYLRWKR